MANGFLGGRLGHFMSGPRTFALRLHASISDCKGGSTLVRDYTNLISLLCLGVFFGCVSVSWFSHASIVTHKTMAEANAMRLCLTVTVRQTQLGQTPANFLDEPLPHPR